MNKENGFMGDMMILASGRQTFGIMIILMVLRKRTLKRKIRRMK